MAKLYKFTTANIKDLSKTGVYAIVNQVSGKFYIGSASYVGSCPSLSGFYCRWWRHLDDLEEGNHHCSYLQNAWNKYEENNFQFRILEFVEPEYCIEAEQEYLDCADKSLLYNSSLTAGNCSGYKKTPEQIEAESKPYYLISPEGIEYEGLNLAKFARSLGCARADFGDIIYGKKIHHKGWTNTWENHKRYLEAKELRGLCFNKRIGKWCLRIYIDSKYISLGNYSDLQLAKEARNLAEVIWDKEFQVSMRGIK